MQPEKKDVGNLAEALRYRSVKFKSGIVHVQGSVRDSKTHKKDIYGSRKSILIFTILTPVTHKSSGLDIPSLRGLPGLGDSPRPRSRLEPGHRHVRPGYPEVATSAPRHEGVANPTSQE